MQIRTESAKDTKRLAADFAEKVVTDLKRNSAAVVALEGDLGAGKTTFVQGFARALGVKENVLSPTFVLMKVYKVGCQMSGVRCYPKHLIHIDCYRLDSPQDLLHLGFKDLLKDKDAIILIEWADRIKKIIPTKNIFWIKFRHGKLPSVRTISIRQGQET